MRTVLPSGVTLKPGDIPARLRVWSVRLNDRASGFVDDVNVTQSIVALSVEGQAVAIG
jgi:hypothetical protein